MVAYNVGCVNDSLVTEYPGQQKKNNQNETSSNEMVRVAKNTRLERSQNFVHPSHIEEAALKDEAGDEMTKFSDEMTKG